MFNHSKTVRGRLFTMAGLFIFNLVIVCVVQLWSSNRLTEDLKAQSIIVSAIKSMVLVDMMHDGINALVYKGLYFSAEKKMEAFAETRSEFGEYANNIVSYLNEIAELHVNESIDRSIAEARPNVKAYVDSGKKILDQLANDKGGSLETGDLDSFNRLFDVLPDFRH